MCNSYKSTRLARDFVNLTGEDIRVYDAITGNVIFYGAYTPKELPTKPSSKSLSNRELAVHYLVTIEQYHQIKASGRRMDDIAVVSGKSDGRIEDMANLVWGKRPNTAIALMRHFRTYYFEHL